MKTKLFLLFTLVLISLNFGLFAQSTKSKLKEMHVIASIAKQSH